MVNELINDAYVIKHIKPKGQRVESFEGGNTEMRGEWYMQREQESSVPVPYILPSVSLSPAVPQLYPFFKKPSN